MNEKLSKIYENQKEVEEILISEIHKETACHTEGTNCIPELVGSLIDLWDSMKRLPY